MKDSLAEDIIILEEERPKSSRIVVGLMSSFTDIGCKADDRRHVPVCVRRMLNPAMLQPDASRESEAAVFERPPSGG